MPNRKDFIDRSRRLKRTKAIPKEIVLEADFRQYAVSIGFRTMKLVILNQRGFPDVTIFAPGGKIAFAEFKRPGKKISANQKIVKSALETLGFPYEVIDNLDDGKKFLGLLAQ